MVPGQHVRDHHRHSPAPRPVNTQREEAADPGTSPERLHELTQLDGDRGDIDSDSGWCREYVASNPSASARTLEELARDGNDHLVRLGVAENPSTHPATVGSLLDDPNEMVSWAARIRLNVAARPAPGYRIPGTPMSFDPATGRLSH